MDRSTSSSSHSMEDISLNELVKKAKEGDEKALDKLRKQFEGYLGLVRSRLPEYFSDSEKEGIFLEALWLAIKTYNHAKAKFSTWFFWKLKGQVMEAINDYKKVREILPLDSSERLEDTGEDVEEKLEPLVEDNSFPLEEDELEMLNIGLELKFEPSLNSLLWGISKEEWASKIKSIIEKVESLEIE